MKIKSAYAIILVMCFILCACRPAEQEATKSRAIADSSAEMRKGEFKILPQTIFGQVYEQFPDSIDPQQIYVFYIHGQIIEDPSSQEESPKYGVYEYEAILDTLAEKGLYVISERHPANTDVRMYAEKVVEQIGILLAAGVPPQQVVVIGFSKGATISMVVSTLLRNEKVGFVVLAGCYPGDEREWGLDVEGNFLSIYDANDDLASTCEPVFESTSRLLKYEEIVLHEEAHPGYGHAVFYKPKPIWTDQVVSWIEGNR